MTILKPGGNLSTEETEAAGHHFPGHVFDVFLGGSDPEHSSTEFTFGGEYELRLTRYLGVGAIAEHTPDGH